MANSHRCPRQRSGLAGRTASRWYAGPAVTVLSLAALGLLAVFSTAEFSPIAGQSIPTAHELGRFAGAPKARGTDIVSPAQPADDSDSLAVAFSDSNASVSIGTEASSTSPSEKAFRILAAILAVDQATLTVEQVRLILGDLETVVNIGEDAIPAIRQFLLDRKDLDFHHIKGQQLAGERPTLRIALYDVLRRIGGTGAVDVLRAELQVTSSPLEIEAVAAALEALTPNRFRSEVVTTALEALSFARDAKPHSFDVRPLFKLIKEYGDESIVDHLERDYGRWQTYAIATLAEIAGGHGIPALIDMAESPPTHSTNILSERSLFALQMLTQVAPGDLRAADALIGQAESGKIPESMWPRIALTLAGDYQFQLDGVGDTPPVPVSVALRDDEPTQTIYLKRGGLTELSAQDREARLVMVDRLLETSAGQPAIQALEGARELLTQDSP